MIRLGRDGKRIEFGWEEMGRERNSVGKRWEEKGFGWEEMERELIRWKRRDGNSAGKREKSVWMAVKKRRDGDDRK